MTMALTGRSDVVQRLCSLMGFDPAEVQNITIEITPDSIVVARINKIITADQLDSIADIFESLQIKRRLEGKKRI